MSEEETFLTVAEDDDGQRLDRWLKQHLPYALIQKLIRKGAIRVDGKKAKGDLRLAAGQEVRLPPLEEKHAESKNKREGESENKPKPALAAEDVAFIKSLVIYDDGEVMALNKPPGLAVQGGTNTERHVDGMLEAFIDKKGVKPRLVHRLDKDTSGVLLLARSAKAARELGRAFKGREIRKIYWAIVIPAPDQNEGTIKAPLIKAGGAQKERMVIDEKEGKWAETDFIVLDRAGKQAAFMAFQPRTGRTHQIRVHAADALECPVLGDGKYGGAAARLEGMDLPKKLHLHARRIILPHPLQAKKTIDITAPLSDELKKSWKAMGFDTQSQDDPFVEGYCAVKGGCA